MELFDLGQSHHTQRGHDRASGGRQEAAGHQNLNVRPYPTGKYGRERKQARQDGRGRVWSGGIFSAIAGILPTQCLGLNQSAKVEIRITIDNSESETGPQVILDVRDFPSGNTLSEQWERANIITTVMHLPSPRPTAGRLPDGIRLGVQELTRLGMRELEMREIADLMHRAISQSNAPEKVATSATHLVRSFPTVYYTFDNPNPPGPRP